MANNREPQFAEDVKSYWKTSNSSPDTWMKRAAKEIEKAGGKVVGEAFGAEASTGRSAYMLSFRIGADHFKVVWPVLPSRSGNTGAARRQAATMLYHDVKARAVSSRVLGGRAAFFSYLVLPDGRVANQAAVPELLSAIPRLLTA
jgi:hypothetical protein